MFNKNLIIQTEKLNMFNINLIIQTDSDNEICLT